MLDRRVYYINIGRGQREAGNQPHQGEACAIRDPQLRKDGEVILQNIDNSSSEESIVIDEENITAAADARSLPFSGITFSNNNTPEI